MKNEGRKAKLLQIFSEIDGIKDIIFPLIDEVVFLEDRLTELRKLPFIRVNPKNPAEQKATVAPKQYKEFLQQYNNCIKILCSALSKNSAEEESPLRAFIESRKKELDG